MIYEQIYRISLIRFESCIDRRNDKSAVRHIYFLLVDQWVIILEILFIFILQQAAKYLRV
jgi:hypothetical protein